MSKKIKDKKTDILAVDDRDEQLSSMEPLLISETSRHRSALQDMAVNLAAKAAGFRRSLPTRMQSSLRAVEFYGTAIWRACSSSDWSRGSVSSAKRRRPALPPIWA